MKRAFLLVLTLIATGCGAVKNSKTSEVSACISEHPKLYSDAFIADELIAKQVVLDAGGTPETACETLVSTGDAPLLERLMTFVFPEWSKSVDSGGTPTEEELKKTANVPGLTLGDSGTVGSMFKAYKLLSTDRSRSAFTQNLGVIESYAADLGSRDNRSNYFFPLTFDLFTSKKVTDQKLTADQVFVFYNKFISLCETARTGSCDKEYFKDLLAAVLLVIKSKNASDEALVTNPDASDFGDGVAAKLRAIGDKQELSLGFRLALLHTLGNESGRQSRATDPSVIEQNKLVMAKINQIIDAFLDGTIGGQEAEVVCIYGGDVSNLTKEIDVETCHTRLNLSEPNVE